PGDGGPGQGGALRYSGGAIGGATQRRRRQQRGCGGEVAVGGELALLDGMLIGVEDEALDLPVVGGAATERGGEGVARTRDVLTHHAGAGGGVGVSGERAVGGGDGEPVGVRPGDSGPGQGGRGGHGGCAIGRAAQGGW